MTNLLPSTSWRSTLATALILTLPMAALTFALGTWPLIRAGRAERMSRALEADLQAARDERDRACAVLTVKERERDQARADVTIKEQERDQAKTAFAVASQERDHARAVVTVKEREGDQARADLKVKERERDQAKAAFAMASQERDEARSSLGVAQRERDEIRSQHDRDRLLLVDGNQALQRQLRQNLVMLDRLEKQLNWAPFPARLPTDERGMSPLNFALWDPQPVPSLSIDRRPKQAYVLALSPGPIANLVRDLHDAEEWIRVLIEERGTLADRLRSANDTITRTNAAFRFAQESMRQQSGVIGEVHDRVRSAQESICLLRAQISELLDRVVREGKGLEAPLARNP